MALHDDVVARGILSKVHVMVSSLRGWLAGADDPRMQHFGAEAVDRITEELCRDAGLTTPKKHPWGAHGGAASRKKGARAQQSAD